MSRLPIASYPSLRRRRPSLTRHAESRAARRGIRAEAVELALEYGRVVYTRGAVVHAIGKKEIARWAAVGLDLSPYDGIQVVCSIDGAVLTVYRNRRFRRLRTGLGRGRHNHLPCGR
jgi:hypothetical protein